METSTIGELSPADSGSDVRAERHPGRSVSLAQAAKLLNISRRTVYYRIREGRLRTVRVAGGSQRVLVDSVYQEGVTLDAAVPVAHTEANS